MYRVTIKNDTVETVINAVSTDINSPRIDGSIKQGINTIDTFTFSILPSNKGYNKINALKTLVEVLNTKTNKMEFKGRILLPKHSMNEAGLIVKNVVCESELAYLMDSIQEFGEYHDTGVKDFLKIIISNHNKQVSAEKKFVVGNVTVEDNNDSLYRFLGYEKTFNTIKDKLIDRLGGELQVRYENGIRYLDYLKEVGAYKNTTIELAKNLKTIEEEQDPTAIITRLVPLGAKLESHASDEEVKETEERLTIAGINGGLNYIDDLEAQSNFGIIVDKMTWDDVNEVQVLLSKGKEFLKENNRVKKKYSLNALDLSIIGLDLDSFEVGNYHKVFNPIMQINEYLRIIEKTIDINSPYNSSLNIGDKFDDIKTYQNNLNKAKNEINNIRFKLGYNDLKLNEVTGKIEEAYKQLDDIKHNSNNYYIFDIRNKTASDYVRDLVLSDVTVMQSFDIDKTNNVAYFGQMKSGTKGDNIITKVNLTDNSILGTMTLENFGHATNIAIEEAGLDTYIWCECVPRIDSKGDVYGMQIGRFKFENGVTLLENPEQVFDLLPSHYNTYPSIDKINNRLCVKSICNSIHYYSLFDLDSVLMSDDDNSPILISQFKLPSTVNVLPFQGFTVFKDYIYNYEGCARETVIEEDENGNMVEAIRKESTAYVTVFNSKGNIQYRQKVNGFEDMTYREAEGIQIKQLDANNFEMYLGFSSGATGSRKANVIKYSDTIESR